MPLHATTYYLNSRYHYNPNFKVNLERMVSNASEMCKIDLQLESFKDAKGLFGIEVVKTTKNKKK